jgi:DNA-binding beta-propeller fold protein YncE
VANRGSNNVSVIEGDAVRYVVPVGAQPCALAADAASGRVFVANEGDKTISVIEKLAVADTWALPDTPGALAVIGGQLWVGMRDVGSIRVLSAANGSARG